MPRKSNASQKDQAAKNIHDDRNFGTYLAITPFIFLHATLYYRQT